MRCSCQNCGEYMVQDEHGVDSRCICPVCFNTCSLCVNNQTVPKTREELQKIIKAREELDSRAREE